MIKRARIIGIEAGAAGGHFCTRPLCFSGSRLKLNVEPTGPEARLRVQLLAWEDDQPLEGYTFELCDPLGTDDLDAPVRWRGAAQIDASRPGHPPGAVGRPGASRETLTAWVEFAREHDAIILFDAAYEAYITDPEIPHSIYEIDGAREVAIEFRSFSKNAGFTGIRCACTVIPHELTGTTTSGERIDVHRLWNRRHSTKFNGVSYPVQRGAQAAYSPEGQQQVADLIRFYLDNARLLREGLEAVGITVYGGVNAPYVWLKTPGGVDSWTFFDQLLDKAHLVGTPGSGFGAAGEGYFRLSAFNSRANVEEAVRRFQQLVG